uniref:Elongation of fatty acids protein n=1 Tax=Palpitomonas bilix TaxID=652834 RepID=A0A7S3CZS5_9EUKA
MDMQAVVALAGRVEATISDVVGFDPRTFVWSEESPLTSSKAIVAASVLYLVFTFIGVQIMKPFTAFKADFASKMHNFFMFIMSGFFCFISSVELLNLYASKGLFLSFCPAPEGEVGEGETHRPHGTLVFYCYLFYLSKFYELFETILLIVKKRDMGDYRTKLHIFHHAIVPVTIACGVWGNWTMPIILGTVWNSLVHTVMYFYFFLRSININPGFKVFVTYLQIFQFVNGGVYAAIYFVLYFRRIYLAVPGDFSTLTYEKGCAGELGYMVVASGIDFTFLALFVILFGKTYGPKKGEKKAEKSKKGGKAKKE